MLNDPICLFQRQKVDCVNPEFSVQSSRTEWSASVLF